MKSKNKKSNRQREAFYCGVMAALDLMAGRTVRVDDDRGVHMGLWDGTRWEFYARCRARARGY